MIQAMIERVRRANKDTGVPLISREMAEIIQHLEELKEAREILYKDLFRGRPVERMNWSASELATDDLNYIKERAREHHDKWRQVNTNELNNGIFEKG